MLVCVQIEGVLGSTLHWCQNQSSIHNACQRHSVTFVVVEFKRASAQPGNATRVITCCTSGRSCFDRQTHPHSVFWLAQQWGPTHCILNSAGHSSTVQRASCTEPLFTITCSNYGRSCTLLCCIQQHLDLPQPQSVTLTGVSHELSSWRCMLHETKQPEMESLLPEAPQQLPSITRSGILLATQKAPESISFTDTHSSAQS